MSETNAERLLQVKENLRNTMICLGRANGKTLLLDDLNWLIQQAELLHELEKEMKDIIETADVIDYRNQVMREALKFYSLPIHYQLWQEMNGTPITNEYTNDVTYDGGEKARQALGESHAQT